MNNYLESELTNKKGGDTIVGVNDNISSKKKLSQRLGFSASHYSKVIDYIEERIAFAKFGL